MKFADRVKQSTVVTSTAIVTLGGALAGYRSVAKAIAAGALKVGDTDVAFSVDDGAGMWELGLYTITSTTQLTRTSILASSADGAAVAFGAGTKSVTLTVPAAHLAGTPLTDYLAANDAGTPAITDVLPLARGAGLFGVALSALASAINKLWPGTTGVIVTIASTAALPLDFTTHHRRRVVCTSTPAKIAAPASFASVGNGFECRIHNLSGADIPVENITLQPAGVVIPAGASADVYATGGALFAALYGAAASSSGGGTVTAPGQASLAAGVATSSTQPATATAPTSGTAPFTYKWEFKKSSDSTWSTASSGSSNTSYAYSGLAASTSYDYRVSAVNSAGTGAASAVATKTTAASSGGGGGAAPFTATARTNFPQTYSTFTGDSSSYLWSDVVATGSATVAKVEGALSKSNTVAPTSAIAAPNGKWFGALTGTTTPYMPSGSLIDFSVTPATNFYYWLIVTDSDGNKWTFCHVAPISFVDGATAVRSSAVTPYAQVQ